MGTWPGVLPGRRVNVGTGLDGITERHICDGSRHGGQASDQANLVGQAGAGNHGGQVITQGTPQRPDGA
jgi:hypothetical protein